MTTLPHSARVVVIGGGIGGVSAAYHLACLGMTDVLLLERSALSAGTTWHSTGNMETYRADPLVYEMVRYAATLYPALAAESGRDIGWRQVGRVMYTDREDRWRMFRSLPELGRARGIELVPLSAAEVAARLPIIDPTGLLGGLWIPSDARINPTDAVMAFAACARARGVLIVQDAAVESLLVRQGAVHGVVTATGTVACETVVIAAGLWSAELARASGLALPLYALEHQYLITKPIGIDRHLPLFLSYDDQLYGREEVGGLMVGSLDDAAIPLSAAQLPQNFSFALLGERWEQFTPYLETAMRRFPLLREAPVRMLLNGPESFTPDGQMLLGPVPGADGAFAACAFNSNGMALAPAAGRFVAEWIVEGAPSADVTPLDVRRFAPVQATETYLRARVTEIPGYHCRLHAADDDYHTARDVRRSAWHDELAAAGARFGTVAGWERPLWFARAAASTLEAAVAAEARAGLGAALAVDRSADACVRLHGAGALDWLARVTGVGLARLAGQSVIAPLAGPAGEVEAVVRVLAATAHEARIVAAPDQQVRVYEWLLHAALPDTVEANDESGAWVWIDVIGPRRLALLAALRASAAGGPDLAVYADLAAGALRLGWPVARSAAAMRALADTAAGAGLVWGGQLAAEALRIRRGEAAFGHEAGTARLVTELWPGIRPPVARPVPRTHVARELVALDSPLPDLGLGGREPVLAGDVTVGELTSRARVDGWPQAYALALLDPSVAPSAELAIVVGGARWPVHRRLAGSGEADPPGNAR